MTPENEKRLEEIEERVRAATDEPWIYKKTSSYHRYVHSDKIYGRVICYTSAKDVDEADENNIHFIAASRADTPWLIDLVREMEKELKEVQATYHII